MQSISRLIDPSVLRKASKLNQLTRLLRACLPKNCHDHVAVVDIQDDQLVLITDSPVWVNRLRMYHQSIVDMLRQHTEYRVSRVRIRHSRHWPRQTEPTEVKIRRLSSDNARIISRTALSIGDEKLSQALMNLAKNLGKGD